jgi:hypothetical protein
LGEGDIHIAVFANYQFRAIVAPERFVKARPGCAVGANTQARCRAQGLFVPEKLPCDVSETLLEDHLQALLAGAWPFASALPAVVRAGY